MLKGVLRGQAFLRVFGQHRPVCQGVRQREHARWEQLDAQRHPSAECQPRRTNRRMKHESDDRADADLLQATAHTTPLAKTLAFRLSDSVDLVPSKASSQHFRVLGRSRQILASETDTVIAGSHLQRGKTRRGCGGGRTSA
jgi:hypothetical protein